MRSAFDTFSNAIPRLHQCTDIQPLLKGYSYDNKYIVYTEDTGSGKHSQPTYILRTYPIEQESRKKHEFEILEMMHRHKINCTRPVEIGQLPEQALGYMLVSYVPGEEAHEAVPQLSEKEQFQFGLEAGAELFKIHQISSPQQLDPWEDRMLAKHKRYREAYKQCGVSIKQEGKLLEAIDSRLHFMKNRPNLFQHDDYHLRNLIIHDKRLAGVIDFDRSDWGDPLHDFVKVGIFSSEISTAFSIGQIQGYFKHQHQSKKPDSAFWERYTLYLAMTLISSVVWILKVKPDECKQMMEKIDRVMDDHHAFESIVPQWYTD